MNTRRLSMILLAPFTLLGGMIIGYEVQLIRAMTEVGWDVHIQFFLVCVLLVLFGFVIRHRLLNSYDEEIKQLKDKLDLQSKNYSLLEVERENQENHYGRILRWVEDVIQEGAKERGIVGPFGVDLEVIDQGSWGNLPGQDRGEPTPTPEQQDRGEPETELGEMNGPGTNKLAT